MIQMEKILNYIKNNKRTVIGTSAGFIIGVLILVIGFFQTIFIAICVGLGYYFGKRFPEDKEHIKSFLDRILPPGMYR